jgi:hypothetical protein
MIAVQRRVIESVLRNLQRAHSLRNFFNIVIKYRFPDRFALGILRDLDHNELNERGYRVCGGVLESIDAEWDVPNFDPERQTGQSLQAQIDFYMDHLESCGCMLGVFRERYLVRIGIFPTQIQSGIA